MVNKHKKRINKVLSGKRTKLLIIVLIIILLIHAPFRDRYISLLEFKPLSEQTLNLLLNHNKHLDFYSNKYDIPIDALAASIGSEINRRIYTNKLIDIVQDYIFSTMLVSNSFLELSLKSGIDNRYLNFTKQDIGLGSIKVETAWDIYNLYSTEFDQINSLKDMVNYLLTVEGNIKVASLIIMHAKNKFKDHYQSLDNIDKSAVLFSYYKQGESYYNRYVFLSNYERPPIPGGGKKIINKLNTTIYKDNSRNSSEFKKCACFGLIVN